MGEARRRRERDENWGNPPYRIEIRDADGIICEFFQTIEIADSEIAELRKTYPESYLRVKDGKINSIAIMIGMHLSGDQSVRADLADAIGEESVDVLDEVRSEYPLTKFSGRIYTALGREVGGFATADDEYQREFKAVADKKATDMEAIKGLAKL